jgi:hypothetical protein
VGGGFVEEKEEETIEKWYESEPKNGSENVMMTVASVTHSLTPHTHAVVRDNGGVLVIVEPCAQRWRAQGRL